VASSKRDWEKLVTAKRDWGKLVATERDWRELVASKRNRGKLVAAEAMMVRGRAVKLMVRGRVGGVDGARPGGEVDGDGARSRG